MAQHNGQLNDERREAITSLQRALGDDKVSVQESDIWSYSYDSSYYAQTHKLAPDAVVFPQTAADVRETVKIAAATGTPVTARGAGTGQTGGACAANGGFVTVFSRMNRVLELDTNNLQVWVEPGVVHAQLNSFLAQHGFFFPPDPGSGRSCTIGGMIGNNASGPHSVKYGVTSQYVFGMRAVLADSEEVTLGGLHSSALKSVSGYDLTKLFVGSEGTLGIFTAARLKVLPLPITKGLAMVVFDDLENAAVTVGNVFKAGIIPAAVEIMDRSAIQAIKKFRPSLDMPVAEAILLFEIDGNPPGVEYEGNRLAKVVKEHAASVEWTTESARIKELWDSRSLTGSAVSIIKENGTRVFLGEDIAVPISEVPRTLRAIHDISRKHNVVVVTYGHIGDGNVHSAPVIDLRDQAEREHVLAVADEIHRLALESKGTVTGEHGIGAVRAEYMEAEHGPALEVMRSVKRAIDPHNIMNPGKMGL